MESLPPSNAAQAVLDRAAQESTRLGHHYVGVEHVFAALIESADSPLGQALRNHGVALDDFAARMLESIQPLEHRPWGDALLVTPRCREITRLAGRIAARNRRREVTQEHLLEAIFREGRSVPMRLLRAQEVPVAELYESLTSRSIEPVSTALPLLDRYGRDLTALARDGGGMPFVGREGEIREVVEVLLRRRKNNPVLVGEAGVGKTAVVEGLASALLAEDERHPLRNSRIIELSMASLVAGTKYRGDLEERMLGVLKEATSHPEVILFFDEIHTLVGAGSSSGETVAASEIMKPALARGDLRCIGATTITEYRRYIERDAALERRFEPVTVEEPRLALARDILRGVAPSLAEHHGVEFLPEALDAALELTVRYVPHRRLPDKAIDALDQSGARSRLAALTAGVANGERPPVTAQAIACTVSQWTGIALERLSGQDVQHLLELEESLRRAVLGQDHACRAVARAILTSKAGLADPERPVGSFLFMGPTGVGKTELARTLARLLFGDERRLIRFDMSEYMEPHSVARLIGAPPGYVGHEQEGQLVSAVRTHPDCIVLFDEIEKAHSQVFDLFLQVLEGGRLTDAHGKQADFRHAVVILTSNLQFAIAPPETPLGFVAEEPAPPPSIDARLALSTVLRPELVNRIDEILVFQPLPLEALRAIVDRYVHGLQELTGPDLRIELAPEVYGFLIERGVSPRFGARELRRTVDRHLRQPLAEQLIRRRDASGVARAEVAGDRIVFRLPG